MKEYSSYSIKDPMILEVDRNVSRREGKYSIVGENNGCIEYSLKKKTGINIASIVCAGQIPFLEKTYKRANFDDLLDFRSPFYFIKKVNEAFSDLSIANFDSMVAKSYPGSEKMAGVVGMDHYSNSYGEYLDALNYGAFDYLAMANQYNACLGVKGVAETEVALKENGLMYSGIGDTPLPIFNINGLRIGVLSYAEKCNHAEKYFSPEGMEKLLSVYGREKCENEIRKLKENEVDFILAYLSFDEESLVEDRKSIAKEIAEAGADYVICTIPKGITKYIKYTTSDNRVVPIATGLNCLVGYESKRRSTAMLNIMLSKDENGNITIVDSYVPFMKVLNYRAKGSLVLPGLSYFGTFKEKAQKMSETKATVKKALGEDIAEKYFRGFSVKDEYDKTLTYGEAIDILDGNKRKTIEKFKAADINLDDMVGSFIVTKKDLRPGCAAFLLDMGKFYKAPEFEIKINDAVDAGATMLIDTVDHAELPTIVVENPREAYIKIAKEIMKRKSAKVVAITGTSGKTTTTQMISTVSSANYNTLSVRGNFNTIYTVFHVLQHVTNQTGVYVQEVHGGTPGSAPAISKIISPDIAVITSIGEGHLEELGTVEGVLKSKMGIIEGMKPGGVLVVDDDNEYLHGISPDCRVIRCSLFNKECDVYAQNIKNDGKVMVFDVCYDGGVTPVLLNAQGEHNIKDALSAFAVGLELGIEPDMISLMLSTYQQEGIRQNLINHCGYNFIVDIYSNQAPALITAMKMLGDYPREMYPRKIAILGDMPTSDGENSVEAHKNVGEAIADNDYDILIGFGGNADQYTKAAQALGKEAYYFDRDQIDEMNEKLYGIAKKGDLILLKSGIFHHIEDNTIYPLFGKINFK